MRLLLTSVIALSFFLLAGCLNPTPTSEALAMPDAASVESIVNLVKQCGSHAR